MQNSIHKHILLLFFLFLFFVICFSLILHTPKDMPSTVSVYQLLLYYFSS
ncbi:hypothetical protein CON65_04460 [Bacillus pseudomycoides]|uniref:Uncharacterized protein n=1 Tax=Bacillus pseudomycoides TaxID=64104 RepID=A0AA91VEI1_9BACI|nr:hypothetical protein COO03_09105 [Bacillus sp. AFS098217]PED83822.1 hypothetical protein CON65_04460 [Bacillus pseudomycoides]PEU14708.1 hypothetical protein CN524_08435 [Bacillus sp. AFS019443]PEU19539.1 hypothetical protein CN525_07335 [Bacillus sp. AFS014408]PFW64379.1 hypothetical protein COL20_04375 [Bacillus sp. AFS075034]